jgi:hypothetical protein
MERKDVDSSMITSVGYDFDNSVLEIEFKSNGQVWRYVDVPESVWHEFDGSSSKGKFFLQNIKKQYAETQIG